MIVDGTHAVFGRMASVVAQRALRGEKIDIINCEKIIITGSKDVVFDRYMRLKKRMGTPRKGPFYPKIPDRFVRRLLRGMLPYKQERGSEAYKRIMCHVGVPKQFEGLKTEQFGLKELRCNHVTIGQICNHIGGWK